LLGKEGGWRQDDRAGFLLRFFKILGAMGDKFWLDAMEGL
jgi:hypothetical protein